MVFFLSPCFFIFFQKFTFIPLQFIFGIKKFPKWINKIKQVSRRGAISGASPNKRDDDQEIAALAAITGAIMEEVKKSQIKNKHNIIQIVIYESSV